NPQMAAGYYTPKAGTGLWSAARDLKLNGGINSSLYGRSQMPSALNMMGQLAVDQSVIVAVCCPTGLSPTGHAIVVNGPLVEIAGVFYRIVRDPGPNAPDGGNYLKPVETFDPYAVNALQPLPPRVTPPTDLDPQRVRSFGDVADNPVAPASA